MKLSTLLSAASLLLLSLAANAQNFKLKIDKTPGAGGVVVDGLQAIRCGDEVNNTFSTKCEMAYAKGARVNVNIFIPPGMVLDSWTGACAGQGIPCVLVMNQDATVSVRLKKVGIWTIALAVQTGGSVNASGSSVQTDCPSNCKLDITLGFPAFIKPTIQRGYVFGGWTDLCAGQPGDGCRLPSGSNGRVGLLVNKQPDPTIRFTVTPPSNGVILDTHQDIRCGEESPSGTSAKCTNMYIAGTRVALRPLPKTGRTFAGWTGACASFGTDYYCYLPADGPKTIGANFK